MFYSELCNQNLCSQSFSTSTYTRVENCKIFILIVCIAVQTGSQYTFFFSVRYSKKIK